MKKLISILLIALMICSLGACSSDKKADTEDGKTYKIGIIQLTEHAALDAAREGFIEA